MLKLIQSSFTEPQIMALDQILALIIILGGVVAFIIIVLMYLNYDELSDRVEKLEKELKAKEERREREHP